MTGAPTPSRDPFRPPCCDDADGECPQHEALRRLRERAEKRAANLNPAGRTATRVPSQGGVGG